MHGRNPETPRPKFVVSSDEVPENFTRAKVQCKTIAEDSEQTEAYDVSSPQQSELLTEPSDSSWRAEVTARLNRYQARRRPRAPRYPSLRLKFETADTTATSPARTPEAFSAPVNDSAFFPVSASRESVAIDCVEPKPQAEAETLPERTPSPAPRPAVRRPEPTAKIIEFPRPDYEPPVNTNDLAEPIFNRPRILEAPEVVPPPPALGGILIEEVPKAEPERRPGIDMPLHPAPVEQRLAAMMIDCILVLVGVIIFGAIYYQLTKSRPPILQAITLGSGLLGGFWAAYQYLLVVYSGSTPGLGAMKLQLLRFDGTPAKRSVRRWRVLCSWLSAMSLGMGYLWQFLDEDGLCWHERVTRTYLASPRNSPDL